MDQGLLEALALRRIELHEGLPRLGLGVEVPALEVRAAHRGGGAGHFRAGQVEAPEAEYQFPEGAVAHRDHGGEEEGIGGEGRAHGPLYPGSRFL